MANTETFQLDYTTDFGTTHDGVRFKVERGLVDRIDSAISLSPVTLTGRQASCGTAKYYQMRKAVVKFTDGFSVEVPIAELGIVNTTITALLGIADVVCVTLKGEKWKFVPPGIIGASYAGDGIASPQDKPNQVRLTYEYSLDGDGDLILSTSVEVSPQEIYDSQISCLNVTTGIPIKCAGSSGISPRKFIGERVNLTTGGTIRRQIIVGSNEESIIKSCGASQAPSWNCFSYIGQSIPNAGDYYSS